MQCMASRCFPVIEPRTLCGARYFTFSYFVWGIFLLLDIPLQVRRAEGISDLESVHLFSPGLWEDDTPRELPGIPQVRHQKYSRTRIRGRPRGLLCRCATASPKQTIKITHDPTDNPNRDPKRAQVSSMLFGAGVSGSGELSAFAQSLVIALQCVLIAFFKSAPVGVGWNFQLRS